MSAIFRNDSFCVPVTPTANMSCGDIIKFGSIVGVAVAPIAANTVGYIQISGEYDVDVSSVTASAGDSLVVAAKTLSGGSVNVVFGYLVRDVASTDTVAHCMLVQGAESNLPAPVITATASHLTVTVAWTAIPNAREYLMEYSTSSTFADSILVGNITGTSKTISSLSASTKYYFRLKSIGDGDYKDSAWSSAKNATTEES